MSIITKLQGGLGNQMFQYATGRSVAQRNGAELKLDIFALKHDPQREYALGCFNTTQRIATQEEISKFLRHKTRKGKFWFWYNRWIADEKRYTQEKQFNFDQHILELKDPVYLDGAWQTEKYFKDIRDLLQKEFTLRSEPSAETKDWIKKVSACTSVSLHIRRGDYVSNHAANQFHGTCPIKYYEKAINLISQKIKDPVFFIFSDEIAWAKDNLNAPFPLYFISGKNISDCEEMTIMSSCKNNIIANSSFSWWGAWLNKNPYKLVIAPQKWFTTKKMNTADLTPESWTRI